MQGKATRLLAAIATGGGGRRQRQIRARVSYLMMTSDASREIVYVPKGLTEGTIEIRAMTIYGQRYDSQKLSFKRESSIGVAAVSC